MKTRFTRVLALILSLMLLFALAACSKKDSGKKDRDDDDGGFAGVFDTKEDRKENRDDEAQEDPGILDAMTEPEPVYEKRTVYLCTQEFLHNYEGGDFLKGYTYDEYGRVFEYFQIKDDGSRGWVNTYTYDEDGNNIEIDTGSSKYIKTYDEEGHILSQLYTSNDECVSEEYYTYDANGYLIEKKRIERYSEEVSYTYEVFYSEDYSEAMINQFKNGEPNGTTYETYNAAGQVLTSEVYDNEGNWKSTQKCTYDAAGNLLQQGNYSRSETQADYQTIYTYDENGLLISKNVDYYYGYLLTYTYEPFEILVRVN